MPDGDEVRETVGRNYQGAYKRICADKSEDDDLVIAVVRSTVERLKKYGDEAVQLVANIAHLCEAMHLDISLFSRSIDYAVLRENIATIAQETCMDKRAKNLVLQGCKESIEMIRRGGNVSNIHIEMLQSYFWSVYRSDFEAYVESGKDHMHNASPSVVNATLARMRPHVRERLQQFAERAYRDNTLTTFRPRLRYSGKEKGVPIDLNLLNI
ncbi:hypothetical protein [Tengunoibacter tsumagoiensis]|nr:hypothetical protein [Tengunoibacter tsumagoiensis]